MRHLQCEKACLSIPISHRTEVSVELTVANVGRCRHGVERCTRYETWSLNMPIDANGIRQVELPYTRYAIDSRHGEEIHRILRIGRRGNPKVVRVSGGDGSVLDAGGTGSIVVAPGNCGCIKVTGAAVDAPMRDLPPVFDDVVAAVAVLLDKVCGYTCTWGSRKPVSVPGSRCDKVQALMLPMINVEQTGAWSNLLTTSWYARTPWPMKAENERMEETESFIARGRMNLKEWR